MGFHLDKYIDKLNNNKKNNKQTNKQNFKLTRNPSKLDQTKCTINNVYFLFQIETFSIEDFVFTTKLFFFAIKTPYLPLRTKSLF